MLLFISGADIKKPLESDEFKLVEPIEETIAKVVLQTCRRHDPTIWRVAGMEERLHGGKHIGTFDCKLERESRENVPSFEMIDVVVTTNPRPDPDLGYQTLAIR